MKEWKRFFKDLDRFTTWGDKNWMFLGALAILVLLVGFVADPGWHRVSILTLIIVCNLQMALLHVISGRLNDLKQSMPAWARMKEKLKEGQSITIYWDDYHNTWTVISR